jgi:hypothetical protein
MCPRVAQHCDVQFGNCDNMRIRKSALRQYLTIYINGLKIRICYYINSNGAEIFKNNYTGRDRKTSREILTNLMFGWPSGLTNMGPILFGQLMRHGAKF